MCIPYVHAVTNKRASLILFIAEWEPYRQLQSKYNQASIHVNKKKRTLLSKAEIVFCADFKMCMKLYQQQLYFFSIICVLNRVFPWQNKFKENYKAETNSHTEQRLLKYLVQMPVPQIYSDVILLKYTILAQNIVSGASKILANSTRSCRETGMIKSTNNFSL